MPPTPSTLPKKRSRHQLVDMVLEFIITERKAGGGYYFNWQLCLDFCLR